jgi:hypothetical protein
VSDIALILLSALFGVLTHVLKTLVQEKAASGEKMTPARLKGFLCDYFVGNILELLLMVFLVIGGLVIALALNELTMYSAYLTGYAGNSVGDVIGRRASKMAERVAGAP